MAFNGYSGYSASGLIGYQAVMSVAENGLDVIAAFCKNKSTIENLSHVQLDLTAE